MSKHEEFVLEKFVWTEADFEKMGWHDSHIHAISFQWSQGKWTGDLLFDIDYIFKWNDPKEPDDFFTFWISPCTLIFPYASRLKINLDLQDYGLEAQEINNISLLEKVFENEISTYKWRIELQTGYVELLSEGLKQIVRQKPIYTSSQELDRMIRGGISFSNKAYG